ncbi:MAG: PH domain-containing protein [Anaerolineales bacterium]|nr:PH domain-containing protein [Anaerolineales bacterium]
MGYIESLLGRNERIVFCTRQHWIQLVVPALLMIVLVIVLIVVGASASQRTSGISMAIAVLLSLAPIGFFVRRFSWWWYEQYLVTNRRVIQIEGVLDRHVIDSSLEKVNDVVLRQSVAGRLFGFGDIEILTGSEIGINQLNRIHRPIQFKTEMLNQKEGMGEIDAFESRSRRVLSSAPPEAGDIPELIAELDELRSRGVLSQEEFDKKKKDLLDRL